MYSILPLILLADWILNTVFDFVLFKLLGLVAVPFILLFNLDKIFP